MRLSTASVAFSMAIVIAMVPSSRAYSCGANSCRPNSTYRTMSPRQKAQLSRQQAEFVNRAFEVMANDLQKQQYLKWDADPNFIPRQKAFVNKAVEFFADLGGVNRQDAENLRDITNRGFEIVQDMASGAYSPAYEIIDGQAEIEISLDVPGVARENIDVILEEGVLKINGTRKINKSKNEEVDDVMFSRSFPVDGNKVDTESISASLESGVLTIRIAKKDQEEKPAGKRIDIR
jgi:HSP20 family protein